METVCRVYNSFVNVADIMV